MVTAPNINLHKYDMIEFFILNTNMPHENVAMLIKSNNKFAYMVTVLLFHFLQSAIIQIVYP